MPNGRSSDPRKNMVLSVPNTAQQQVAGPVGSQSEKRLEQIARTAQLTRELAEFHDVINKVHRSHQLNYESLSDDLEVHEARLNEMERSIKQHLTQSIAQLSKQLDSVKIQLDLLNSKR